MFNNKGYNEALFNDTSLYFATISIAGYGSINVLANYIFRVYALIDASGNLGVYMIKRQYASGSFNGISDVQVIPLKLLYGNSLIAGLGSLTVNALKKLFAISQMNSTVDLSGKALAASFIVTSDGILMPLNVYILRDSREELLPGTRDYTEEIPGRHGEIDFGSEFRPRVLELHVVSLNNLSIQEREKLKRNIAKYFDPTKGVRTLIFDDDDSKTYNVKYSGKIDLHQYPTWLEFVIPFKLSSPFIESTFPKVHVGNGVLVNDGTIETPLQIKIQGPATDPVITIGNQQLKYIGSLTIADVVEIDTEKMTVKFNGVNALANYQGSFPKLPPGETQVTVSGGTVTFTWKDRWL